MLFVREINRDNWINRQQLDAVCVSDLNNSDNEISVWEVQPNLSDIDDIALAVMMRRDRVQEITIVFLDSVELNNKYNISMHQTPGNSNFTAMNAKHNNFVVPTFWQMGYLTEHIQEKLQNPQANTKYYSEPKMKSLLFAAYQGQRIPMDVIKRNGKVMVICSKDKSHKQTQG